MSMKELNKPNSNLALDSAALIKIAKGVFIVNRILPFLLLYFVFQSLFSAYAVSKEAVEHYDMDTITIYGDDGRHYNPPHSFKGPDGKEGNTLKGPSAADIAEDQAKKADDEMRKTIDSAGNINLDILTREIEGPGGSLLWILWEVTSRALKPSDVGTHPMENPDTYKIDAYRNDRIEKLRIELEEEAKKARKNYDDQKARNPSSVTESEEIDPAKRVLATKETALVKSASYISASAGNVAEIILRYGRKDSAIKLETPSPALKSFTDSAKIPVANACWSAESKLSRMIPYTVRGKSCPSFYRNGTPTSMPGITTTRPFGNVCRVSWGTCQVPLREVAGAPCWCISGYAPPGLPPLTSPGLIIAAPHESL